MNLNRNLMSIISTAGTIGYFLVDIGKNTLWSNSFLSTLFPIYKIASYFFPIIGSYPHYSAINVDNIADNLPICKKKQHYSLLGDIQRNVGLNRQVSLYTKNDIHYSSNGGNYSFLSPIIYVPKEQLFPSEGLTEAEKKEAFNEKEIEFQLTRHVCHIHNNYDLIKTIVKVVLGIFTLGLIFLTPFSILGYIGLFLATHFTAVYFERCIEKKLDNQAIDILSKKYGTRVALEIARSTFSKILLRNKKRHQSSFSNKLLFTKTGEERFYFEEPSLNKRVRELSQKLINFERTPKMISQCKSY